MWPFLSPAESATATATATAFMMEGAQSGGAERGEATGDIAFIVPSQTPLSSSSEPVQTCHDTVSHAAGNIHEGDRRNAVSALQEIAEAI